MKSEKKYSGLFFQFFEENRRDKLKERCYEGGEFTGTFSASDWRIQPVEVAKAFDNGVGP